MTSTCLKLHNEPAQTTGPYADTNDAKLEELTQIQSRFFRTLFESERMQVALFRDIKQVTGHRYFKVEGRNLIQNRPCVLCGKWRKHPKYGASFVVERTEEMPPPDEASDITAYLTGIHLKGIGEVMAKRIYEMYGEESLHVIEDPEKLVKVRGISVKKAKEISEEWKSRIEVRQFYDLFRTLRLQSEKAPSVCRELAGYGADFERVKNNPYLLCKSGRMTFQEVDDAVMNFLEGSFFFTKRARIDAGLIYCMLQAEGKGNVFVKWDALTRRGMNLLFPQNPQMVGELQFALMELIRDGTFVYDTEQKVVYREKIYEAEEGSANLLSEILRSPKSYRNRDKIRALIEKSDENHTLSEEQKKGIENAFLQNVSIITGGPGTGKTYTLRIILKVLKALAEEEKKLGTKKYPSSVTLCAPTGRAARKMEENAGYKAHTIHHTLKLTDDGVFAGRPEPLETDLVIVDEFSMVGIELFYSLLRCMKPGMSLVMIGDKDQLPSVSCGNVLNDLIQAGKIPVTVLTEIFRQKDGSSIISNAYAVNHYHGTKADGTGEDISFLTDDSTDIIRTTNTEDCTKETLEAVRREVQRFGVDHVQVLTPLRKRTSLCVRELNKLLQELLNPPSDEKAEFKRGDRIFRVGDRIMHLKNIRDDSFELSNGDVGKITNIDEKEKDITVIFEDERIWSYQGADIDQIEHAFATTVHKSQGSEYDAVILPFVEEYAGMRQKKILYTAMTRAKKKLVIVGDPASILFAAANEGETRNTLLGERLKKNLVQRTTLQRFGE